ncbi:DUF4139 domain-containing protein [Aestuariibius insulae]|uniref:DUF4139 domain-containing protein n=1 Tax=Aestuariibius insulae TaxID=2058287 RepID=UPI00345EECAD
MRLTTTARRRAVATLIAALLSSTALAQTEGPDVANVDLGQSGVALYTLTQTNPGEDVSITVPRAHADDVLASLIVRDPVGRVIGITTATPADLPESLRGTPFAGGLPSGITALLRAMTGKSVTITTATEEVTGIVLGLSERKEVQGETTITHPAVLLQQESGALTELILRPGASVSIDPEMGDPLRAAAGTINTGEAVKTFDLALDSDAPREIELSYVTEAPAWKNSWRLLLEEGRLQGWAAVENVSGQDWTDIDLTLSTGSPVAYSRDLLTPLRIGRLDPPNLLADRPNVRLDTGFAAPAPRQRTGVALSGSAEMGIFSGFTGADIAVEETMIMAPPARAATELRGIGNVRYAVPEPVDLEAGRTANLLYIDLEIDPQIRALYQPGQSDQILLAVELSADQALAPGLVSVRDANGFVGDAPFAGLASGQTRFLPYASAPNATVVRDEADTGTRIDFRAVDGILRVEVRTQRQTRYTATVPEGVEIFAVEHPKSSGRFIEANGEYEENAGFIRISREVEEGAADISVTEETRLLQQFSLDSNGLRNALSITAIGSAEIEEADRAVLTEASTIMERIEEAQQRLGDLTADYERLTDEQQRLRDNLRAVQLAELRRRYETGLIETEDEIETTLDALDTVRNELREAEAELGDVLRRFS